MYSPFDGQVGQYISWFEINEHSSNISMPISAAIYRDTAANSSAETSLVKGATIRRRGASGVWLCVEYTAHLKFSFFSSAAMNSGVALSMSGVHNERQETFPILRRLSRKCPPTKPPLSFISSRLGFGSLAYSSAVSVVRIGVFSRSQMSSKDIVLFDQNFACRELPSAIFNSRIIIISFCLQNAVSRRVQIELAVPAYKRKGLLCHHGHRCNCGRHQTARIDLLC